MTDAVRPNPLPKPVTSAPRKSTGNPVQALTNVTAAVSRPWWAETFSVGYMCLHVLIAPLKIASQIAEAAVALIFLALFAVIGLWYKGIITDEQVAQVLGQVGTRGLSIIQSSGIL